MWLLRVWQCNDDRLLTANVLFWSKLEEEPCSPVTSASARSCVAMMVSSSLPSVASREGPCPERAAPSRPSSDASVSGSCRSRRTSRFTHTRKAPKYVDLGTAATDVHARVHQSHAPVIPRRTTYLEKTTNKKLMGVAHSSQVQEQTSFWVASPCPLLLH